MARKAGAGRLPVTPTSKQERFQGVKMGHTRLQAENYDAEQRLSRRLRQGSPLGSKYLAQSGVSLAQVRVYLRAVQGEPWFQAAWPAESAPITVESSSGTSSSSRSSRVLKSSTAHRGSRPYAELVILHELAHMITKDPHEGRPQRGMDSHVTRGHDRAWRDHYARLVSKTFGPKWAARLRAEFDREPGICTCDGHHLSPACREFGVHPWPVKGTVKTSTAASSVSGRPVAMLTHQRGGQIAGLMQHQVDGAAFAVDRRRVIIADEMGVGKTWEGLSALETAAAFPAVIVCRKQNKADWEAEIAACLPSRSVSVLTGFSRNIPPPADITVVNYDTLHTFTFGEVRGLIVDELHYVKEDAARRTRAVAELAKLVPESGLIAMLSGTPFLNRPRELVSPLLMLGYLSSDRLAPNSAEAFMWRFCARYRKVMVTTAGEDGEDQQTERYVTDFDGSRHETELATWLRKVMIRRLKADVLPELGPKARRQELVRISDPDYARYAELAAMAASEHEYGRQLVELNLMRQFIGRAKVQQAIPWILDFCGTGRKLVVFADHIPVQRALLASLRDKGIVTAALLGETSEVGVREAKRAFQEGDAQVIVCSLKAANVGHTLTAAADVLFIEYGFTPADHDQAEDRIHRIGQTKPVTAHYLSAAGTLDEWSFRLIERKRRVFQAILNAGGHLGEPESIEGELIGILREQAQKSATPAAAQPARSGESESDEYYSPPNIVEASRSVLRVIDLDMASCAEANKIVRAARFYTIADDGLTQPLRGCVYCNPPYSETAPFVAKLIKDFKAGDIKAAILLVNANTDVGWFQQLYDYPLCFIEGRLDFSGPDGPTKHNGHSGSVVAYFGPDKAGFIREFSRFGTIVQRDREVATILTGQE